MVSGGGEYKTHTFFSFWLWFFFFSFLFSSGECRLYYFFLALWWWLFYCPSACFLSLMCLRPTLHVRFFFPLFVLFIIGGQFPHPQTHVAFFTHFYSREFLLVFFFPPPFLFFFTFWAVLVVAALVIHVCTFKAPFFVLAPT